MRGHNRTLLAIAIFKWCNAVALIAVAFGLLKLLHRDVGDVAENFLQSLRIDPDNEFLGALLARLSLIDDPKIQAATAVSFGYSVLFAVEGTGLYFEQRWAEYLTIVATAGFLPLEVYELIQKVNLLKITLLVVNLLIIGILVINIRRNSTAKKRQR